MSANGETYQICPKTVGGLVFTDGRGLARIHHVLPGVV